MKVCGASPMTGRGRHPIAALAVLAGSVILPCGCGDSGLVDLQPQVRPKHSVYDAHTLKDLLRESGADWEVGRSDALQDSSLVVGTVALDYYNRFYDSCGEEAAIFRLALMICCADGSKVTDFFQGVPLTRSAHPQIVGCGNASLRVPRLYTSTLACGDPSKQTPPFWERFWYDSSKRFAESFPEFMDKDFTLTFKEFRGHAYYLRDVPAGTAFVWFQTDFDGNRVTQFPLFVELKPERGRVVRLDLRAGAEVCGDL